MSKFQSAAKAIKQSKNEPNIDKISEQEKYELYGLYKQARYGDNKHPNSIHPIQSQNWKKCQAWNKCKGLTRQNAQHEYVLKAKQLLKKYGGDKYITDF